MSCVVEIIWGLGTISVWVVRESLSSWWHLSKVLNDMRVSHEQCWKRAFQAGERQRAKPLEWEWFWVFNNQQENQGGWEPSEQERNYFGDMVRIQLVEDLLNPRKGFGLNSKWYGKSLMVFKREVIWFTGLKNSLGREISFGRETIAVVQVKDQVAWSLAVALEVRRSHWCRDLF